MIVIIYRVLARCATFHFSSISVSSTLSPSTAATLNRLPRGKPSPKPRKPKRPISMRRDALVTTDKPGRTAIWSTPDSADGLRWRRGRCSRSSMVERRWQTKTLWTPNRQEALLFCSPHRPQESSEPSSWPALRLSASLPKPPAETGIGHAFPGSRLVAVHRNAREQDYTDWLL